MQTVLHNFTGICRFWKMLKNAILDATVTQFKYPQCKSSYHKALQFQNQPFATVTTSKYSGKCDWEMPYSVFLGVVLLFSSGCRCGVGFCFPFRSFMFSLFCSDFRVVFRCVFYIWISINLDAKFYEDFAKIWAKSILHRIPRRWSAPSRLTNPEQRPNWATIPQLRREGSRANADSLDCCRRS